MPRQRPIHGAEPLLDLDAIPAAGPVPPFITMPERSASMIDPEYTNLHGATYPIHRLPITALRPNPFQARTIFL